MIHVCAKLSKCRFPVKSTIFKECLAFGMHMHIRYSASCKITILDRKIEFFIEISNLHKPKINLYQLKAC